MQSICPRWCKEHDDQMVGGMPMRSEAVFVAAKNQIYRGVEVRNVSASQVENGLLDLEANTLGAWQLPAVSAHFGSGWKPASATCVIEGQQATQASQQLAAYSIISSALRADHSRC